MLMLAVKIDYNHRKTGVKTDCQVLKVRLFPSCHIHPDDGGGKGQAQEEASGQGCVRGEFQ